MVALNPRFAGRAGLSGSTLEPINPPDPLDPDALLTANARLVDGVLRRLHVPPDHPDRDDLWLAGLFGLSRAIRSWNPARGRLSTYADLPIRWAIAKERRRLARQARVGKVSIASLDAAAEDLGAANAASLVTDDPTERGEAAADADEAREHLGRLFSLASLAGLEAQAIALRFGLDGEGSRTLMAVAVEMGRSIEVASGLVNRGLHLLRIAGGVEVEEFLPLFGQGSAASQKGAW